MLAHGATELISLADHCVVHDLGSQNGWAIDSWQLDAQDAELAIAAYKALLLGGHSDPVASVLAQGGYDLTALLLDSGAVRPLTTRSDLTELVAAASVLHLEGFGTDALHMPNVPKMSRRKSDSGIDVIAVEVGPTAAGVALDEDDLGPGDRISLVSVKHTVQSSTSSMRGKLEDSLVHDTSPVYLVSQLRVLDGRLRSEGYPPDVATRVYMFVRYVKDAQHCMVTCVGCVDATAYMDLAGQPALLATASGSNLTFRMVAIPGLESIHSRCP